MKICAKCGFENNDNAKQCANCLIDLHWAKLNLGKFQGAAEDTRRIGMESRKQRGISVPEDDTTPLAPILLEGKQEGEKSQATTSNMKLSKIFLYLTGLWGLVFGCATVYSRAYGVRDATCETFINGVSKGYSACNSLAFTLENWGGAVLFVFLALAGVFYFTESSKRK